MSSQAPKEQERMESFLCFANIYPKRDPWHSHYSSFSLEIQSHISCYTHTVTNLCVSTDVV